MTRKTTLASTLISILLGISACPTVSAAELCLGINAVAADRVPSGWASSGSLSAPRASDGGAGSFIVVMFNQKADAGARAALLSSGSMVVEDVMPGMNAVLVRARDMAAAEDALKGSDAVRDIVLVDAISWLSTQNLSNIVKCRKTIGGLLDIETPGVTEWFKAVHESSKRKSVEISEYPNPNHDCEYYCKQVCGYNSAGDWVCFYRCRWCCSSGGCS